MSARREWTTLDLEMFRDGELSETERESLGAALREDPALRQRLGVAARVDGLVERALVESRSGSAAHSIIQWRWLGAIAACIALVGLGIGALWMRRPAAPGAARPPVAIEAAQETPSYRIVWSIPVIATQRTAPREADKGPARASTDTLERALAAGDAEGAAKLLAESPAAVRTAAYRRLGEIIRSADACERLLDSMPPAEQLSVCREWAMDPRLRPVTFARLARLAGDSTLSAQYAGVVGALSEYPELRPWLRSYVGVPAIAVVPGLRG